MSEKPIEDALPIVAVPTVAATGSETDAGAVIVNPETHEKRSIFGGAIMPKAAILDPEYTFSVPKRQTAAGAADILSHLMEQYFVPSSTFMGDLLVESVMKTVVKYAPIAAAEGENYETRAQLLWASEIADNATLCNGNALAVFGVHAMEHQLSGRFNSIHGEGLAVLTPHWMEHVLSEKTAARFARFGQAVFGVAPTGDTTKDAKNAIAALRAFFEDLGIPSTLRDLGAAPAQFADMASHAVAEGSEAAWIPLAQSDVEAIYRSAFGE